MTIPYICRSCRQRLLERLHHRRRPQWQARATYIPLNKQQSAQKVIPDPEERDAFGRKHSEARKEQAQQRYQDRYEGTRRVQKPDQDILKKLFDLNYANGQTQGRYSRAQYNRQAAVTTPAQRSSPKTDHGFEDEWPSEADTSIAYRTRVENRNSVEQESRPRAQVTNLRKETSGLKGSASIPRRADVHRKEQQQRGYPDVHHNTQNAATSTSPLPGTATPSGDYYEGFVGFGEEETPAETSLTAADAELVASDEEGQWLGFGEEGAFTDALRPTGESVPVESEIEPELAEEDVAAEAASDDAAQAQTEAEGVVSASDPESLAKLEHLRIIIEKGSNAAPEAWNFVSLNVKPYNEREHGMHYIASHDFRKSRLLPSLMQICLAHISSKGSTAQSDPQYVPTPCIMLRYFHGCGALYPYEIGRDALWPLMMHLLKDEALGRQADLKTRGELLRDYRVLWQTVLLSYAKRTKSVEAELHLLETGQEPGWPQFDLNDQARMKMQRLRSLRQRYYLHLPGLNSLRRGRQLYVLAAMTYELLTRESSHLVTEATKETWHPFKRFMAPLIHGADMIEILKDAKNVLTFLENDEGFINKTLARLRELPERAKLGIARKRIDFARKGMSHVHLERDEAGQYEGSTAEFHAKQLSRALEREDAALARSVWEDVKKLTSREGIDTKIYNLAIMVLMSLRLPNEAIEVWNHMINAGIEPSVREWTSMISGAGKSKNIDAMDVIWQRMLDAGIKPDSQAWTARINAYVQNARREVGLQLLEELGQKSKADPTHAKPVTETVNAVISVYAKSMKKDDVGRILRWASAHSIQPNVDTFNILIRMHLSDNNSAVAMKLLTQMETLGLEPDMVTFTTIVDSAYRSSAMSSLFPVEVNARISSTLSDLEARQERIRLASPMGKTGNQGVWSYSILLDTLLKRHGNVQAAQAVLSHMDKRGIKPNPYIYTSLITYYFSLTPPDLAAVDALWRQITQHRGVTDHVFWDRMIEGYARHSIIDRMLFFLGRMMRGGRLPGWAALREVILALAREGEHNKARWTVEDVVNRGGQYGGAVAKKQYKAEYTFWRTVHELELFSEAEFAGLREKWAAKEGKTLRKEYIGPGSEVERVKGEMSRISLGEGAGVVRRVQGSPDFRV